MLIDLNKKVTSVSYSEITKELTFRYNDNSVEKYINVPKQIYESILNDGKVVSNYLKETLNTNYKKMQLV